MRLHNLFPNSFLAFFFVITALTYQVRVVTPFSPQHASIWTNLLLRGDSCSRSSSLIKPHQSSFYNDFDDLDNNSNNDNDDDDDNDNDDSDLYAALRERQTSLDASRKAQMKCWMAPPVQTRAYPIPGDWVRRVAMDTTTSAANANSVIVGGATGSLYLLDLSLTDGDSSKNLVLSSLTDIHESRSETPTVEQKEAIQALYGGYDGGGIIALAMRDNIVASSGREGGVQISRIVGSVNGTTRKSQLEAIGKIPKLDSLVTSLAFDQSGMLWVGSFGDGMIRCYEADAADAGEDVDAVAAGDKLIVEKKYEIEAGSGVLSLFLADEVGCGIAATEKDGIILFSSLDGSILKSWNPFQGSDEFARTAIVVQNDEAPRAPPMAIPDPNDPSQLATLVASPIWSVVVGGSSGSLHQQRINLNMQGIISTKKPFDDLSPAHVVPDRFKHSGPITCLASPGPQVLLSGGQDGSIRVWDCSYLQSSDDLVDDMEDDMGNTKPTAIFMMAGYKVWLGSIILAMKNNMHMIVSDGADNAVVAQVFKKAE